MALYNSSQAAQNPYVKSPFGNQFQAGNQFSSANPWGVTSFSAMQPNQVAMQPKPNIGTMAPAPAQPLQSGLADPVYRSNPNMDPRKQLASSDQDSAMVNEIAASMNAAMQPKPAKNQAAALAPGMINQPGIGQVQDPGMFKNKAEYDKWYEEQWRKKMAQQKQGQSPPQKPNVPVGKNPFTAKYNSPGQSYTQQQRPPLPAVPQQYSYGY